MPRPMLLENEVDKRIANNRQFRDPNRNRRLGVDEKPVIVWGWSRGWSASRIGHAIQKNPSSIWYYKATVLRNPA